MQQSPPTDVVKVPVEPLQRFVADLFKRVPIPDEHAELTAGLLVDTQVRGVFSHGVRQAQRYLNAYQEGTLNAPPQTRVIKDGPVVTAIDGDRGLGIIVAGHRVQDDGHVAYAQPDDRNARRADRRPLPHARQPVGILHGDRPCAIRRARSVPG